MEGSTNNPDTSNHRLPPGVAAVQYPAVGSDESAILSSKPTGVNKRNIVRCRSSLLPSPSRLFHKKKKDVSPLPLLHEYENIDEEVHSDIQNTLIKRTLTELSQYGFETADCENPYTVFVTHPDQCDPSSTNTPREERVRTRLSLPIAALTTASSEISSFGFEASNVDDPDTSALLAHPVYKNKKEQHSKRRGGSTGDADIPNVELVGVPGRQNSDIWLTPYVYECDTVKEEDEEREGGWDIEQAVENRGSQQGPGEDDGEREAPEEQENLVTGNELEEDMVPLPSLQSLSLVEKTVTISDIVSKGLDELLADFDHVLAPRLVRAMRCVQVPETDDALDVTPVRREKYGRKKRPVQILNAMSMTTVDDTVVDIFSSEYMSTASAEPNMAAFE